VRLVAYAALASSLPGLVLGGWPEASCSVLTAVLAAGVLAARRSPT
jgi:hypothetical protein